MRRLWKWVNEVAEARKKGVLLVSIGQIYHMFDACTMNMANYA